MSTANAHSACEEPCCEEKKAGTQPKKSEKEGIFGAPMWTVSEQEAKEREERRNSQGYRMLNFYDRKGIIGKNIGFTAIYCWMLKLLLTSNWGTRSYLQSPQQRFAICPLMLVVAACMGLSTVIQSKKPCQFIQRCFAPCVHVAGLGLVVLLAASHEIIVISPEQLMNGAVLALFFEQLLERKGCLKAEECLLVPLSFWISPWQLPCIVWAIALFAFSHGLDKASDIISICTALLVGALYAAAFQKLVMGGLPSPPPDAALTWHSGVCAVAVFALFMQTFERFATCIRLLNGPMLVRSACFLVLLGHFRFRRPLVMLATLMQTRRLLVDLRPLLSKPGADLTLKAVLEAFDLFRGLILGVLWRVITALLSTLINLLLPPELQVYAFPVPFFATGWNVSLGICAIVEGAESVKPDTFVCNVGHIDCHRAGWFEDVCHTARSTSAMVNEFESADKKNIGLVSNVLCFVPVWKEPNEPPSWFKEFNFSAWQSDQHAHDWYVNSPAHKEIIQEHYNQDLRVFGNILTSLKPSKPLRWQGRCSECASIVEGYPEVRECECGAPVIDMPLF